MPPLPHRGSHLASGRGSLGSRDYAFDGMVGPTHHHAGLSFGNLASVAHTGEPANPRASALEGLSKLRVIRALGLSRAVLPPHERPYLPALRRLGFSGSDTQVLERAHAESPALLASVSSASSMWAANAATVSPSSDSTDGRVHLVPANLVSMFHRSLEAETTTRVLRRIFANPERFEVHDALPLHPDLGDEGAANHTRLHTSRGSVHLFGWGRAPEAISRPARYPARQTLAASQAVARLNRLRDSDVVIWQQHAHGIDLGAFHSDVLAVGHAELLLVHELAFVDLTGLTARLKARLGEELRVVVATDHELPASAAVAAYPFNSELLELDDGSRVLVAPSESRDNPLAACFLNRLVEVEQVVSRIVYVNVNGSMKNGGGPACLRLRVALTDTERSALGARVFVDDALESELEAWIHKHYRDRLLPGDLRDPRFLEETRRALDELTSVLRLGSIYDFQRA